MRLSELDDIEQEVLLGEVVQRARADLNDGRPLTEMRANENRNTAARRLRSNLRKEARAINEQNRVPGDPYYKQITTTGDEVRPRKKEAKVGDKDDDLITVCDSCFCACCWQGEFYCDDYKIAGTTQKTRAELRKLNRENESYWKTDEDLAWKP